MHERERWIQNIYWERNIYWEKDGYRRFIQRGREINTDYLQSDREREMDPEDLFRERDRQMERERESRTKTVALHSSVGLINSVFSMLIHVSFLHSCVCHVGRDQVFLITEIHLFLQHCLQLVIFILYIYIYKNYIYMSSHLFFFPLGHWSETLAYWQPPVSILSFEKYL